MRHNCNITTRQVVRYVRHRLGDDGVSTLLAAAGETRPLATLEDMTEWSTYEEGRRLFEAAAEVLGGVAELREAGRHIDRSDGNPEMLALFRSLGSPSELLRFIAETAGKFSTVVAMEAVEIGEQHGTVAARSVDGFPRYPELCEFTAGLLAQSPDMFGCPTATVEERECENRGDERCLFVVSWGSAGDAERRLEHLEEMVQALTERFEALSSTVGDLLSGDDVDVVLEKIVTRAALAIRAPRYMLAVRMDDEAAPRVHQIGFEDPAPELTAQLLDADCFPDDRSCLVAAVRSARRHYGRLAAVNPPGVGFLPDEQSVLATYAKLSAAALDSAAALEASRSQAALAHTLLDLGNQLANASGRRETAQRLANAVTDVVGCDTASVLTYDRARRVMTFSAFRGFDPDLVELLDGFEISDDDTPWFGRLVDEPRPLFFDASAKDEFVRAMLRRRASAARSSSRSSPVARSSALSTPGCGAARSHPAATCSSASPASPTRPRPRCGTRSWSTSSASRRSTTRSPPSRTDVSSRTAPRSPWPRPSAPRARSHSCSSTSTTSSGSTTTSATTRETRSCGPSPTASRRPSAVATRSHASAATSSSSCCRTWRPFTRCTRSWPTSARPSPGRCRWPAPSSWSPPASATRWHRRTAPTAAPS